MKRRAYSADDQRQHPNDQRRQALDERVDPRRYQLLLAVGGMVMKVLGFQPRATTTKTLICPGWEIAVVPVSQPGTSVRDKRRCPIIPGVATGTKENLLSRLVTPTGTKGAASAHVAGAPFCPGWC